MNFAIKDSREFSIDQLGELFHSVGWELDTPSDLLCEALSRSTRVFTAYDGEKLVGIIRSMDDGLWSANIDCLVVHRDYQGQGVGTKLITAMLDDLKEVLYINASPNEASNVSFYERFGFELVEDGRLLQIVR